jgi:hypothetical protein
MVSHFCDTDILQKPIEEEVQMKSMKKDVQVVTRGLKTLAKKTEQIAKSKRLALPRNEQPNPRLKQPRGPL